MPLQMAQEDEIGPVTLDKIVLATEILQLERITHQHLEQVGEVPLPGIQDEIAHVPMPWKPVP